MKFHAAAGALASSHDFKNAVASNDKLCSTSDLGNLLKQLQELVPNSGDGAASKSKATSSSTPSKDNQPGHEEECDSNDDGMDLCEGWVSKVHHQHGPPGKAAKKLDGGPKNIATKVRMHVSVCCIMHKSVACELCFRACVLSNVPKHAPCLRCGVVCFFWFVCVSRWMYVMENQMLHVTCAVSFCMSAWRTVMYVLH